MTDQQIKGRVDMSPQGIHHLFDARAQCNPDATALVCGKNEITYQELNRRSNQLARFLKSKGIGAESIVALCVERSIESVVGALGILKAGGAYLPVDPNHPPKRTDLILDDAAPELILTQSHLRHGQMKSTIYIDDAELFSGLSGTNLPQDDFDDSQLAYLMYTSGSTGIPKGVMVEHRNVANFLVGMDAVIHPAAEGGSMLAVTSLSFDISVLEIFWSLTRGFKVVIHTSENSIPELITNHQITHLQCVPSMARMILKEPGGQTALGRLTTFMVGGEALPGDLAAELKRCVKGNVINLYGPTETTVWSSAWNVEEEFSEIVPIGKPIANTQFYTLDDNSEPVPYGVPGELYIGGAGLSRGYLNRTKLNSENFVSHPFGNLYRTGDKVIHREDGVFEFLGRLDNQVKIRGHRVELHEVETAIAKASRGQARAVVHPWSPEPSDIRLVAWLVSQSDSLDIAKIREKTSELLPTYMVPQHFIELEQFPITSNGKLDRSQLPSPDSLILPLKDSPPPATPTEKSLANLWKKQLQIRSIGRDDHFYELGGHSLSAVEMASRIAGEFDISITPRQILQNPRLKDLSNAIDLAVMQDEPKALPPGTESPNPTPPQSITENTWKGIRNRLLQMIALYAPGLTTLRVWLHRMRGIQIGDNATIGTAAILETAFPELIELGNNVQIGIRATFIGHFGDMTSTEIARGQKTIRIEDNVYIGPNVTILPNVIIGEGSVVTAGSIVNESVPPHTVVQGNPARPVAHCRQPLVGSNYSNFIHNLESISEPLNAVSTTI